MYECEWCDKEITKLSDGIVVKIQSADLSVFEQGLLVHKDKCENELIIYY